MDEMKVTAMRRIRNCFRGSQHANTYPRASKFPSILSSQSNFIYRLFIASKIKNTVSG